MKLTRIGNKRYIDLKKVVGVEVVSTLGSVLLILEGGGRVSCTMFSLKEIVELVNNA